MKTCKDCKICKDESEFYNRNDRKDRKRSICVLCYNARTQNRYKKRAEDPEFLKSNALRALQYRHNHYELMMYDRAKNRAKNQNIPFNIKLEDIIIPKHCPMLGIELAGAVGIASDNSPSLDRIDPKKGYVQGNIVVISCRANRIKNDGSIEEMEKILTWLKERLEVKENND